MAEGPVDETNDAEMETSTEMEVVSPAEKDSVDVPMEAEKPADEDAEMEKPVSEPDPDLVEAAQTLDEDSTPIPVNEDPNLNQVNEDSNLNQETEDSNLNQGSGDSAPAPIKINEDSTSNQLNEDSISNHPIEDSVSNQPNAELSPNQAPESELADVEPKDDDADSNGRVSATNFATFDDESRMSGEKVSVDNVEDVNITENAADEVEEESTAEQEGEDPLLASAEDAEASKPGDEEEILGAHSTHIPVSEDNVDSKTESKAESEKADDPEKSNDVPKKMDVGEEESIDDVTAQMVG